MIDTQTTSSDLFGDGSVTVAEAARFTGLGRTSLYDLMTAGELTYTKVGARRLIPRRALVELLARNATPGGPGR
jgi:excisionase family DNA binding protein